MMARLRSIHAALPGPERVLVLRWRDGCEVAIVDSAKFAGENEDVAVAATVRKVRSR